MGECLTSNKLFDIHADLIIIWITGIFIELFTAPGWGYF